MDKELSTRMKSVSHTIWSYGVVPVIVLSDPGQAAPLARALLAGGLGVAEVTFRSDAALEGIRIMAAECPQLLVGAGTVLSTDQARSAAEAGASFIVTPGFNPTVVDYCIERGLPIYPGISGTGEIEAALERGLEVVKFFPAESLGGVEMLKALAGPYRSLKFMPTGGIDAHNLRDYLALPQVVACGGSWLVPREALAAGSFDKVTAVVRRTMRSVYGCLVEGDAAEVSALCPDRTKAYLERSGIPVVAVTGGVEVAVQRVVLQG